MLLQRETPPATSRRTRKLSDELATLSVTKLAAMIRARAISPVEAVEACLRRIEHLNPRLNAIITLAPDALSQAREAERAVMRGASLGPLHGVPITIKDTIDTAGLRTTYGSRLWSAHVPQRDAPAVARLKAAGAILLGKTNVSELALAYTADNPLFGRTNNPHDLARTPGGSSGGEAAAISACLSPAGLGSDLTGSIRVPAHFCGIFGLKPTTERAPAVGHVPPNRGPLALGACLGPLARTVDDLALVFNILSELDLRPPPARARSRMALRGQRAAWYVYDTVTPVTEETCRAVEAAARALSAAGLEVFEARPPGVERGPHLWSALFSRAASSFVREMYAGQIEQAGPLARAVIERSDTPLPGVDQYLDAWNERDRRRATLIEWLSTTPLVIAPVGATPAFAHEARQVTVGDQALGLFRSFGYAQTCNVFNLPAVCAPAGRSPEGLPIGVQIIGRPYDEDRLFAAAAVIEEALGGWQSPASSSSVKI